MQRAQISRLLTEFLVILIRSLSGLRNTLIFLVDQLHLFRYICHIRNQLLLFLIIWRH